MQIDFFGLAFETAQVTFYLWSPWRAAALEHRLFEAIASLPQTRIEETAEDRHIHVRDLKTWRSALQAFDRVLKGWQEEAGPGTERRTWRWLLEGDTDVDGYDHTGEPTSLWGFLRATIERGGPDESEKGEDIDLEGFGIRIWGDGVQRP